MPYYLTKLKAIEESRVFSTDELRRLRTDPAMYYRLNDLEYSRELNDQDIKIKTQLGIDYIEFYCLQLLNKSDRTPEESRYLIGIRNKLIEDFKNKNFAYINSRLINGQLLDKLFLPSDIEEIRRYQADVRAAFLTIYEKMKMKEKCTPKELSIFFKYLTNHIGSESPKIKEIIDFVVKDNIENDKEYSIFEKQFLASYLAYKKCKEKGMPLIKPYITSVDIEGKKPSWGGLHTGYPSESIIQISQRVARDKKFIDSHDHGFAHVVLHEYEHWSQCYNAKNNKLSPSSYIYAKMRILRVGLTDEHFDEYKSNYSYKECERFANIEAFKETGRLVGEYFRRTALEHNLYVNASELRRQLDRGVQVDNRRNMYYIGDYNIEKMSEIIKGNPSLLDTYPIFRNFYNKDGSIKSFQDLISVYTQYSIAKDYDSIDTFEEILEYKISHGELRSISFNEMNAEDILSLLIILQDYLDRQIRACKNMLDTYNDPHIVRREGEDEQKFLQRKEKTEKVIATTNYIFRRRAAMIKEIMNFAYINKAFIDRYCEWNAQRRLKGNANARLTQFNTVFYGDNGIRTIDTRIDSNPNVAESEIVDEIRELSSFVPGRR